MLSWKLWKCHQAGKRKQETAGEGVCQVAATARLDDNMTSLYLSCIWKIALFPRRVNCKTEWTNSLNFKNSKNDKATGEKDQRREKYAYPDLGRNVLRKTFFMTTASEEGWKINSTTFGPIHVVAHTVDVVLEWRTGKMFFTILSSLSLRKWLPYGKREKESNSTLQIQSLFSASKVSSSPLIPLIRETTTDQEKLFRDRLQFWLQSLFVFFFVKRSGQLNLLRWVSFLSQPTTKCLSLPILHRVVLNMLFHAIRDISFPFTVLTLF